MTEEAEDDEREVELASIAAIYPELHVDPQTPHHASLELEISPSTPLKITFNATLPSNLKQQSTGLPTPPVSDDAQDARTQPQARPVVNGAPDSHLFSFLPSLKLKIILPTGYPENVPPQFHLSTEPDYLPPSVMEALHSGGIDLWEEYGHSQVVYTYIDFLQQEAERGFGLGDTPGWELPESLKAPLLSHDRWTKRSKFEQETFDCGVCLEPKKGSVCYRLDRCSHVFCVSCLQDFYNSAITEGDIVSVKCLAPDCGRENMSAEQRRRTKLRTLHPRELLAIPLEHPQVQRYVDLKLKKKLESDKSTIYCPRTWCQGPAKSAKYAKYDTSNLADFPESDSESEDTEEVPVPAAEGDVAVQGLSQKISPPDRLAICSICAYAFCHQCERSWHGEHINCRPRNTAELSAEEKASYDYIRLHTSPCPTCASPCQKTHGCNHMRCFQCSSHFCYLCSSWLHPSDPYLHYNQPGKECYMRLWELEEGDEGPGGGGNAHFIGGRGAEAAAEAHLAAAEAMQAEEFAVRNDGDDRARDVANEDFAQLPLPAQVRQLRDQLNGLAAELGRMQAQFEGDDEDNGPERRGALAERPNRQRRARR